MKLLICVLVCLLAALSSVQAQENVFPRMVGRWREINTATTIIVEPDGRVFAAGSPVYGAVERAITGGGNFAFENERNRCVYDIEFLGGDQASWGLRYESVPGQCFRTGFFIKVPPVQPRRTYSFLLKNECRLTEIDLFVMYKKIDGEWELASEYAIKPGETRQVKNDLGEPIASPQNVFRYYGKARRALEGVLGWTTGSTEFIYELPDGTSAKFRRATGPTESVNCRY
jgi:hypothetical protein